MVTLGNDRARANVESMNIRGDQLLLVNADSAAKSGLAFYRVDVQCDMLNLSWEGQ